MNDSRFFQRFHKGFTPEEGWRLYRPKRHVYNTKKKKKKTNNPKHTYNIQDPSQNYGKYTFQNASKIDTLYDRCT